VRKELTVVFAAIFVTRYISTAINHSPVYSGKYVDLSTE